MLLTENCRMCCVATDPYANWITWRWAVTKHSSVLRYNACQHKTCGIFIYIRCMAKKYQTQKLVVIIALIISCYKNSHPPTCILKRYVCVVNWIQIYSWFPVFFNFDCYIHYVHNFSFVSLYITIKFLIFNQSMIIVFNHFLVSL